jgi:hypothetical protein
MLEEEYFGEGKKLVKDSEGDADVDIPEEIDEFFCED